MFYCIVEHSRRTALIKRSSSNYGLASSCSNPSKIIQRSPNLGLLLLHSIDCAAGICLKIVGTTWKCCSSPVLDTTQPLNPFFSYLLSLSKISDCCFNSVSLFIAFLQLLSLFARSGASLC